MMMLKCRSRRLVYLLVALYLLANTTGGLAQEPADRIPLQENGGNKSAGEEPSDAAPAGGDAPMDKPVEGQPEAVSPPAAPDRGSASSDPQTQEVAPGKKSVTKKKAKSKRAGKKARKGKKITRKSKRKTAAQSAHAVNRGEKLSLVQVLDKLRTNRDFSGKDLSGLNCVGLDFSGSNLRGAYLAGINLERADLRDTDLERAVLTNANLQGANLRYAKITGSILRGARLDDAVWLDGRVCPEKSVGECREIFSAPVK